MLSLQYPDAAVFTDACPENVVNAYRQTFRGTVLVDGASTLCRRKVKDVHETHLQVARVHSIVVMPLQSAEACMVAAFTMEKCEHIFKFQSFEFSQLTPLQRIWRNKYPKMDFDFWVKYGSWSFCGSCRSFFFNDKYFKEQVYLNTGTSVTPEAMAAYRRSAPDDPVEHCSGSVGISSRWWYLPGMYRPQQQCGKCTAVTQLSTGKAFARSQLGPQCIIGFFKFCVIPLGHTYESRSPFVL